MERRKFKRLPLAREVEFLTGNKSFSGSIRDISYGGIFIEAESIPPVGEEVVLVLFLDSIKIFIKGEVVRIVKNQGFAVRFNYISQENFEHLKNFLYYNYSSEEEASRELRKFLGMAHPFVKITSEIHKRALKEELMGYILERAFLYSPDRPFVLASGKESPYYLDCRKVTLFSKSFDLVGRLFWEEIKFLGVEGVAGMSLGADPIVGAVLAKAVEEDYPLEGLLIRKEPKKYGTERQIEGNYYQGMDVVLVEDVITTGGSVLTAIEALEKENVNIVKVIALVDRQEGGTEKVKERGYEVQAIFNFSEIVKTFENSKDKGEFL